MHTETTAIVIALMFIGGGSASTAGGIKLTTFLVLAVVIWAEVRGDSDVDIGRRRIGDSVQRQALSVALLGVALVASVPSLCSRRPQRCSSNLPAPSSSWPAKPVRWNASPRRRSRAAR